MNEYHVEIIIRHYDYSMFMKVEEENGDLALNKVQGIFHSVNGWIQFVDVDKNKVRVRENDVLMIRLPNHGEYNK